MVWLEILGSLAGFYALLALLAHFYALGRIFPQPPVKYELTAEYRSLISPDGVTLATRHWANPAANYTLLYLHGNYEDLGSIGEYVPQFVAAGYAVFALDYRRYGHSGGTPSEANLYADVVLAYDHVRDHLGVPADRIIIFGYSLGGGPAVELALRRPVAGLILQGAFVSVYRVVIEIPLFLGDKFRNLAKVARVRCPVLVIHGTADKTVPFRHAEKIYGAVTARKEKLFIAGGPHTRLGEFPGGRYWEELKKFTDSL